MPRLSLAGLGFLVVLLTHSSLSAQEAVDPAWNGEWQAEGTLFRIRVTVTGTNADIEQLESLGFEWTSEAGEITGNILRVPVVYAGVSGIVQAELVDDSTAVAIAATCVPEFMVVCALAKDRQAIFRKVNN